MYDEYDKVFTWFDNNSSEYSFYKKLDNMYVFYVHIDDIASFMEFLGTNKYTIPDCMVDGDSITFTYRVF